MHFNPESAAKAAGITLNFRYSAAVFVYSNAAAAAIATLRLVAMARERGLLELDEAVLTDRVTVTVPLEFPIAQMVTGSPDATEADLMAAADALRRGQATEIVVESPE